MLKSAQALDWTTIPHPTSSVLLQIECLRTIDRLQRTGEIKHYEVARTFAALHDALETVELLHVSSEVVGRAGQSFGVSLKTLDAIHVASALIWRDTVGENLLFVTHDGAQANAARAFNFEVLYTP